MDVRSLMTRDPHTVEPDSTLGEVVKLMAGKHIRALPVVEDGEIVGIITDRDVKMALGPDARHLDLDAIDPRQLDGIVDWFMTRSPETIDAADSAADAGRRFLALKVGALPVVDDGDLVGILSVSDLLRAAIPILER